MKNILALNKKHCTGCRMCEQICPVSAIKMIENSEGFIEPYLDKAKCIDCGLCANRCPQLNNVKYNKLNKIKTYAAKNKNVSEQKASSSGGIFSAIANYILENNGVVYGSAFNKEIVVEHIRIVNKEELNKLRGSKYVQSNTKHTFKEVKADLESHKMVLYSGTPCQIAGLKAFLGKEYEKIYTVDFVCHGVPSPKLFFKYIKWLEEKNKSKIKNYEFRNKEKNGWGLTAKVTFENGKVKYINSNLDSYYKSFLEGKTYRECCYSCKYSNTDRVSDITLADYWGIENEHPEFYDEKGVSAILVNTIKGKEIINNIKDSIQLEDTTLEKILNKNKNLKSPTQRKKEREDIYKNIENMDFVTYIKNNLKYKRKIKDIIKSIIPGSIKKKMKKIMRRI